jgi:hypothetical protein
MDTGLPGITRVRGVFWALLVGAVLLALAVPAQSAWRTSLSTLRLRTCIWPTSPQVGQMARLFVVPRSDDDRLAIAGPWTTFVVTRDMQAMPMDARPLVLNGRVTDQSALTVPLRLEMAGTWWIRLAVYARGRPTWQTDFPLTALPAGAVVPSGPQVPPSAGDGCHIPNGSQQL